MAACPSNGGGCGHSNRENRDNRERHVGLRRYCKDNRGDANELETRVGKQIFDP